MLREARNLAIETRSFVGGKFLDSIEGKWLAKVSPVDGKEIPALPACDEKDVDRAVAVAREAWNKSGWREQPLNEKKNACLRLADLMEKHRHELALLDTLETGRAYSNYFNDSIPKAIEALRYFAEAVDKFYDHAVSQRPGVSATITSHPLGVVGIITPWNDPLVVSMWKLAPALLMGNAVVLKPAEQSSYSILKVAALMKEAGFPDGIFNVVTGLGETAGQALALHPEVNGIFFTGSSEVGKQILCYAGQSNMKKVGLECGGKSAFIVSKKCQDLAEAARVLALNMFYNQGQICSAPSRVYAHESIKDSFLELLESELVHYVPGNPFDRNTRVGCVVSQKQYQRVSRYIETGRQEAIRTLEPPDTPTMFTGNCLKPIVFEFADEQNRVCQEEIFGPVLSVLGYDNLEDAIERANRSSYGLAASIWSDDLNEALYAVDQLQAGIVHVNSYGDDDNAIPFGGIKESGIGKDKSIFAFHEYTYQKSAWIHFKSPGS